MPQPPPHAVSPPPAVDAVVVTGGAPLPADAVHLIDAATLVVAADSGLDRLAELGRLPHLVVGDLDSVSPEALAAARRGGVPVDAHPVDKDATDTELALRCALDRGARSLTLLTGGGDRLDHVLGWLAVLAHPALAEAQALDAWCATTHLQVLHGPRQHRWHEPDDDELVSLIPLGGPCHGVTTSGLRWGLSDAALWATSSRGLSNTTTGHEVAVGLTSGVLAVVRPHRRLVSPQPPTSPHGDPS